MTRPPDVLVLLGVVAAANSGRLFPGDGWASADEVAHQLRRLGVHATAQQAAAWLGRLSRRELVEALRPECEPEDTTLDYRIAGPGHSLVVTTLPGVRLR